MEDLDNLKSKITYENKTIFGMIYIILGFFWGICFYYVMEFVPILILPGILLIIPSPKIKNSKILAVIAIIISLILLIIFGIALIGYFNYECLLEIILNIYGLFCALLLAIQTEPKQTKNLFLSNLKSTITYENKTIFGVIGIIVGFLFWVIGHPGIGIVDILIFILPCILLIIPSPTIKNSKILAVIAIIILLFLLIVLGVSFRGYWLYGVLILELILDIYGLFCAFLLTIETEPKTKNVLSTNNNISNTTATNFDKYCSECGHGLMNDTKFCPGCGRKLNPTVDEPTAKEDEKDELKCKNCGTELNEEHIFCPQCGKKIKTE